MKDYNYKTSYFNNKSSIKDDDDGSIWIVLVFVLILVLVLFMFSKSLDSVLVYQTVDGECVKVESVDGKNITCDNLPETYQIIYIGE